MADPLSLLRRYNLGSLEIIERDNQIIFGDNSFPKNVQTIFRCKGAKGSPVEYYTLECLLYFLKNYSVLHPDYCRQAAEANIPAVRRPDRKDLLKYLFGEIDTSASIDQTALYKGVRVMLKRPHDAKNDESVEKKPRVEGTQSSGKKAKRKRNKKKKKNSAPQV